MSQRKSFLNKPYYKIPLVYLVISFLWIIFTDRITYTNDLLLSTETIQNYKGIFFIAVTSFIIYYLVRKNYKTIIKANKEIKRKEERLSLALEATNDAVWDWHIESDSLYWSPRAYTMLGYEPDEFIITFEKWKELLHNEDREKTWSSIQHQIQGEERSFNVEFRIKCKDNTYKWINGRGKVVELNERGELRRMAGTHVDIEERKKLEIELHENRDLLNSVLDSSPLPIMAMTLNDEISAFNKAAENLFGWKSEDVIGKPNPIIPVTKKQEYKNLIERVIAGERLEGLEVHRVNKDGESLELSIFTGPLTDQSGTITGLMAIFQDIAERKKNIELLRESEERFRGVLKEINLVAVMMDATGKIIFCNRFLADTTGRVISEIQNNNWFDIFVPPDIADSLKELFTKTISSGEYPRFYENEILTKDGKRRMIAWNNIINKDSDGNIIGVTSIGQDITDKIIAEKKLEESRLKYKTVADYTFDWEYWLSEDGEYNYISPSCRDITGYSPEEFISDPELAVNLAHPEDHEKIHKHYHDDFTDTTPLCSLEFRIITKDDNIKWLSHHCRPVINEEGKFLGRRGTNRDITERKKAVESLKKSEAKYRNLYNSMTEGFCLHNMIYDNKGDAIDYMITDVNPSYERIIGFKKEECVNKIGSELYKSVPPPYLDVYSKVTESGKFESFETYFEPLDQYFSISVFSPQPGQFATIFEDITKRKKAELELKEKEEQYRSIVQNSNAVFFKINSDGVFTLSEGRGLGVLGLKPGEAVGLSAYDMYKNYPVIIRQINKCLAGNHVSGVIEVNGISFDIFYNPQYDENKKVIGLHG